MSLRKGAMFYEYIHSCEEYNEASLPLKERLFNKLENKGITERDYIHAQKNAAYIT